MASTPYSHANAAQVHSTPSLAASTAAAVAAGKVYRGIWFNVAGALDLVDLAGNLETVTGAIGSCYPCMNRGVVTGGGTTLTEGQFICLEG